MSQIYKVNLLNRNNIQKIFVFKGKYEIEEQSNIPSALADDNPYER